MTLYNGNVSAAHMTGTCRWRRPGPVVYPREPPTSTASGQASAPGISNQTSTGKHNSATRCAQTHNHSQQLCGALPAKVPHNRYQQANGSHCPTCWLPATLSAAAAPAGAPPAGSASCETVRSSWARAVASAVYSASSCGENDDVGRLLPCTYCTHCRCYSWPLWWRR